MGHCSKDEASRDLLLCSSCDDCLLRFGLDEMIEVVLLDWGDWRERGRGVSLLRGRRKLNARVEAVPFFAFFSMNGLGLRLCFVGQKIMLL